MRTCSLMLPAPQKITVRICDLRVGSASINAFQFLALTKTSVDSLCLMQYSIASGPAHWLCMNIPIPFTLCLAASKVIQKEGIVSFSNAFIYQKLFWLSNAKDLT